jgi:hypothetical protein
MQAIRLVAASGVVTSAARFSDGANRTGVTRRGSIGLSQLGSSL